MGEVAGGCGGAQPPRKTIPDDLKNISINWNELKHLLNNFQNVPDDLKHFLNNFQTFRMI